MSGKDTEHISIAGASILNPSPPPPIITFGKKEPLQKLAEIDDLLSKGIGQLSVNDGEDPGRENCMSINEVNPSSLIADELNRLSVEERDEVLHDLHGVANILDERPTMVDAKLSLLEKELARIPDGNKDAYGHALRLSPEFVQDRKFRIMFLRADRFKAKHAALRLVNFFERKQRLFGQEKLAKKITLDDLDEGTRACLNTGYLQLLPGRDRSGRAVIMGIGRFRQFRSKVNLLRAFWYVTMAATEDEETQKRGVVLISYAIGSSVIGRSEAFAIAHLFYALPLRIVGAHACVDDPKLQALVAFTSLFAGSHSRHRLRIHIGSSLECQYSLLTFGIPTHIQPISHGGALDKTAVLKWLDMRRKLEEEQQQRKLLEEQQRRPATTGIATGAITTTTAMRPSNIGNNGDVSTTVLVPGPKDILLGRGRLAQLHPGNVRYRKNIEKFWNHYETALKAHHKTNIATELVHMLNYQGWRFLRQCVEGWAEVPVEVARAKVSHWFRNRRGLLNGAKKKGRKKASERKQLSKSKSLL